MPVPEMPRARCRGIGVTNGDSRVILKLPDAFVVATANRVDRTGRPPTVRRMRTAMTDFVEGQTVAKAFNGTINLDIRDSVPDWAPYTLQEAPEGAPNVLVVLYDDTG